MYSGISAQGQAFEGNTMKGLARAMYDHRARQVQVINHLGEACGEINVAAFNEMIRNEEHLTQQTVEWQEANYIGRDPDEWHEQKQGEW